MSSDLDTLSFRFETRSPRTDSTDRLRSWMAKVVGVKGLGIYAAVSARDVKSLLDLHFNPARPHGSPVMARRLRLGRPWSRSRH